MNDPVDSTTTGAMDLLAGATSLFTDAHTKSVLRTVPLRVVLEGIATGAHRQGVATLRGILATEGEDAYKTAKSWTHAFTPCCSMTTRDKDIPLSQKLVACTGLVHFDFDGLADPATVKRQLAEHPSTVFAFLSPRGNGLKVALAATGITDGASYKRAWHHVVDDLARRYPSLRVSLDPNIKYVQALCFVSDDPQLYQNGQAVPYIVPATEAQRKKASRADPFADRTASCADITDYARVVDALTYIANQDAPYDDWLQLGMALHASGEPWARGLWDTWSQQSDKYDATKQEASWESFTANGGIGLGTLFYRAEHGGWTPPDRGRRRNGTPSAGTRAVPNMSGEAAQDAEQRQNGATPEGEAPQTQPAAFFDYVIGVSQKVFIPRLLGERLLAHRTYCHTASQLWVYQAGVYRPTGEAMVRAEAQALLGKERREGRLNETLRYIEVATRLAEEPPPDTQCLNLRNGRLDIQSRLLTPHTPTPFCIVQLPIDYDPAATCPTFMTYLTTTFDADVHPLIEELLGWCLVPDRRFEQAVMLIGEGENGKSVFLDLLGYLLGEENVSHVALQDLEENRFKAAQLYGKLANIFADLDARRLESSTMLKTLTTGDPIDAERKHEQPFSFRSYAKLLFSANKLPSSRDRSHAFYRRWLIIPFTRTFDGVSPNAQPDKELRTKLKKELSGVLNYALRGLARLTTAKAFSQPQCVVEAKKAYVRSNDNVRVFLEECVLIENNTAIVKQDFYRVYEIWCDRYGERAVSQKALKEALMRSIPRLDEVRAASKDPWSWLGMQWSQDAQHYMPSHFSEKAQEEKAQDVPF